LRGGGRAEGELQLSNAWWTDERDGLTSDKPAPDHAIERRFRGNDKLAVMALACTATRKRVYAKASFDPRDGTGQSVLRHVAPLVRSRIVRFNLSLATSRLLEQMF
jgi:hypothetical protein